MPKRNAASVPETNAVTVPSFEHITSDNLSLKIADSEAEIIAAQKLRYDVFYKELGAHPVRDMAQQERDYDEYDALCDHLLVIDEAMPDGQKIVGTYRIALMDRVNAKGSKLYTETEFDISKLKSKNGKIMEISRSCVLPSHRGKSAINLLWKGIAAYVFGQKIDYLIGTPSFPGTDIKAFEEDLAYLNAYHAAPEDIRPRTLDPYYLPLPVVPKENINVKRAFMNLPPLIKGYLRVGTLIGDGLYIDEQFNCTDISVVTEIATVDDRYFNHYKRYDV
jgi:L-ornithine Nalpha-acyltransferase